MRSKFWNGLLQVTRDTHAAMLDQGMVTLPNLWVLTDRPIAHVTVRPIKTGEDAFAGIVELSNMAAAAGAWEIVATWENWDVARACGHEPDYECPCLCVLYADRIMRRLHRFPYDAGADVDESGKAFVNWQWRAPVKPDLDPLLPPAIMGLADFAFKPLDPIPDPVRSAEAYGVRMVEDWDS